jgi:DNA-damage-inducible protein J
MHKSAFVRARINPELKQMAENVLDELGITPTQAVTMLYKRIIRDQEWPIELKIPNEETRRTLEETDQGVGLNECSGIEDLFKKLGI